MYQTIKENASAEIVEKKSKFIANVFYVESKEEAENIIKQINKQYHDARHNCYAYRVLTEEGIAEKSSDDGEPSGTAGAPMLHILTKQNIVNVLVMVTRYFGGILLGTGGLVKAYTDSTKNAIARAELTKLEEGFLYQLEIKYTDLENLKYFLKKNHIKIQKMAYLENVHLEIFVPENDIECLNNENINEFHIIKIEKIKKAQTKNP